jgi:hypothetical protein
VFDIEDVCAESTCLKRRMRGSTQRWKDVTGQAAVSNPLPYIAPFSEIGRAGPGTKEDRRRPVVYARQSLNTRSKIGDMTRNRPEVEAADCSPQMSRLERMIASPTMSSCIGLLHPGRAESVLNRRLLHGEENHQGSERLHAYMFKILRLSQGRITKCAPLAL